VVRYAHEDHERIEYTPYGEVWIEKRNAEANGLDIPYRFTGKERDEETGLYYYGARYLDGKASMWLPVDLALGEYQPEAPVNDEARERNGKLPGMGGVFNTVNLHLYHYAGNNPVKYTDPDGKFLINNVDKNFKGIDGKMYTTRDYATMYPMGLWNVSFSSTVLGTDGEGLIMPILTSGYAGDIVFENGLNNKLHIVENVRKTESKLTNTSVTAKATKMKNGFYQIDLTASISMTDPFTGETTSESTSGTIAFASNAELLETPFGYQQSRVNAIANQVLTEAKINVCLDG
jgi:RHS repeat-associated protein